MKIKLSKKWVERLLSVPETGMGYQTIDVTLKDGRVIKGVNVFNAEDLELPDEYKSIKIEKIQNIKLCRK